ncbi:hypothetical protein BLNAU_20394 [Blattamonas nauphoetae]|uniref:Uncharacterized protein n=1 Tax=Blattamonas nauphoetae TaxID=2049346 RepID=A0ABQ9WYW4_9EUKA|nr:hypothetical protein BLNAU_20394 [Blattamonas nauphoetae]
MVRDGFKFDGELVTNASAFLSFMSQRINPVTHFFILVGDLLKAIGQGSTNPASVFLDSIMMLLSSSHPSIFREALSFVHNSMNYCSASIRLALISSKLIPRILSIPHFRDLSVIDDELLSSIVSIFRFSIEIVETVYLQALSITSHTPPESIRDVVFHEVFIPMEPSLVQISRNPLLLSSNNAIQATLMILSIIFETGAFHQPSLDLIGSSHFPLIYPSLLSEVENEGARQLIIWFMSRSIVKWEESEAVVVGRGRIVLQMLEQEEYSPFLKWNPSDSLTVDSIASIFVSLVSMVRDDFQFDEELVSKAVNVCGFDYDALVFVPSMDGQGYSRHREVEFEFSHQCKLEPMSHTITKWKESEADVVVRGRIVLQTLEEQGFRDYLEQTLLHDNLTGQGYNMRFHTLTITNNLGMNSPRPQW